MVLFICTGIIVKSASQPNRLPNTSEPDSALLMQKLQKTLRGGQTFNSVINGLEIVGYPLFLIGLSNFNNASILALAGFEMGFPAMEMSKYSPIPLVKAEESLIRLKGYWKDRDQYTLLMEQVTSAKRLSFAAMSTAFISQALFIAGCFSPHSLWENPWMICSFIGAGLSVGLAIATTIEISLARKTLGKHTGDLGLKMTNHGLGVVYRLPVNY